jgi:hypothetical protein
MFFAVLICARLHSVTARKTTMQNFTAMKTSLTYLLHGLSPRANYTDRATAASRRSDCQLHTYKNII